MAGAFPTFSLVMICCYLAMPLLLKLALWDISWLTSVWHLWPKGEQQQISHMVLPNTPTYLRGRISSEFGVTASTDLGTYLGVFLLRGRVTKKTFHSLIDRTRRRLAGWKVKCLSKAACSILLGITAMTLPLYTMQTTAVSKTVLANLERLYRHFFWGETNTQRPSQPIPRWMG